MVLLSSPNPSGPAGGDETDLPTGRGSSFNRGSLSDMLVVSSSVGMLDRIHGHASNLRPAIPLGLVLVEGPSGLQHGLVDPAAAGHDAHHGPIGRGNDPLGAGGQLDPGAFGVRVVGDDRGVVAGSPGQFAPVAGFLLQVGDDGSFGHHADGHHVANRQLGLFAAVDELAGMHAFAGNHQLFPNLVPAIIIPIRIIQTWVNGPAIFGLIIRGILSSVLERNWAYLAVGLLIRGKFM